jgi:hypothetical protein
MCGCFNISFPFLKLPFILSVWCLFSFSVNVSSRL